MEMKMESGKGEKWMIIHLAEWKKEKEENITDDDWLIIRREIYSYVLIIWSPN